MYFLKEHFSICIKSINTESGEQLLLRNELAFDAGRIGQRRIAFRELKLLLDQSV